MVDQSQNLLSKRQEAEFDRAFELLRRLVDLEEADQLFEQRAHTVRTHTIMWRVTTGSLSLHVARRFAAQLFVAFWTLKSEMPLSIEYAD